MSKVFVVLNGDGLIMAICKRRRKANTIVSKIGLKRWNEMWTIAPIKLDDVDKTTLAGCEEYRHTDEHS